ncbi:MAG: sigma-70 family RNA polymerase sigma factor [Chloroflexi bacterium]|nr:sigma-70 family RNA polymerase sigma factor [Chloroflexota bacterium]
MGFAFLKREQKTERLGPTDLGNTTERYETYFPRLFAYVYACVGGDEPAQEIVVQAFHRAFQRAGSSDEDRFQTVLFRSARRMCRPVIKNRRSNDGDSLNPREHEVMSLVFDAGLTFDQIAHVFHISETSVSSLLMTGLRKLKEQTSPAPVAAYNHLA